MRDRLTRYGFLLWFALALTWAAIRIWVLDQYYASLKLPAAGDLRGMLTAAHAAFVHGWAWVFDPSNLQPLTRAAGVGNFVMLNPPPLAVVLDVVGRLPWPLVAYLWVAFNGLLFAAAMVLVSPEQPFSRRLALVAAAFGFFPVFVALGQGNDTAIAVFGLALAYRLERDGRTIAAGAALALVTFKPQLALLLPVALVASGRWRLLLAGAGGVAGAALVCLVVVGPGAIQQWVLTLALGRAHVNLIWSQLNTAAYYLPHGLLPLLMLVCAAVVAYVAWRSRADRNCLEVIFPVVIVASLLAAPYVDPQEFAALLIAGWLAWRAWPFAWFGAVLVLLYAGLTLSFLNLPSPVPWVEGAFLVGVLVATLPSLQGQRAAAPAAT